jgi:hypothetical protein
MFDHPAPGVELLQAALRVGPGHADEVGDGDEERPVVGIARPEDGVDLEHRPARVGAVDRVAVVDDPLEDGHGDDPHRRGTILSDMVDLAEHAQTLADGIEAALPRWVERSVERVYRAWAGPPPAGVADAARRAGRAAAATIGPQVHDLLAADVDAQWTTPLTLVRSAVPFASAVLEEAGVPPAQRDAVAVAMFPEDIYGLAPASFVDLDPSLADPGLAWGAAKAWTHRRRHQP